MRIRLLAAAATLLAITAPLVAPLAAQDLSGLKEPISPDRPNFTNSPDTVAPGHFQLETGYTFTRKGPVKDSSLGELLLRYGLDERCEARLGLSSYHWTDTGVPGERRISGFQDPFVEVKVRLNDAEAERRAAGVPAMGLLVQTTIPVGARALTSDAWQPRATLAFLWNLTKSVSLGSNLGCAYLADSGERFTQCFASLSAGVQMNDKTNAFFEGLTFSKESARGSSTQYLDTGVSYSVSNDLQLDVRVGAGLNSPRPNWFTGLGASVRF
ncbi:MAG TPA: transporter [Thermoanaerobaculia bacterium]|jgi:hypothetical protein